jgi:hypothetical protein
MNIPPPPEKQFLAQMPMHASTQLWQPSLHGVPAGGVHEKMQAPAHEIEQAPTQVVLTPR